MEPIPTEGEHGGLHERGVQSGGESLGDFTPRP